MNEANKSKGKLSRKDRKLTFEEIQRVMTTPEMKAFAALSRIKYGTAEPADYATLAKHMRMLSEKHNAA